MAETGEAHPVVVMLHSSGSSSRQWRSLQEKLGARYQTIAPDLCGYAPGESLDPAPTFEDDRARVAEVRAAAGRPVHLVGHSYGGLLAASAAIADPSAICSLTVIEPVCFHLLEEAGENRAHAEIDAVRERQMTAVASGDNLLAADGFISYWMGAETWQVMPEDRRQLIAATMPKVALEWSGAFGPTTRLADYRGFPFPMLIMTAADSTLAARSVAELIGAQDPSAKTVEIASGGHMAPVTNPAPVNAAITEFLNAVS